jgi:hypothetical protein
MFLPFLRDATAEIAKTHNIVIGILANMAIPAEGAAKRLFSHAGISYIYVKVREK